MFHEGSLVGRKLIFGKKSGVSVVGDIILYSGEVCILSVQWRCMYSECTVERYVFWVYSGEVWILSVQWRGMYYECTGEMYVFWVYSGEVCILSVQWRGMYSECTMERYVFWVYSRELWILHMFSAEICKYIFFTVYRQEVCILYNVQKKGIYSVQCTGERSVFCTGYCLPP